MKLMDIMEHKLSWFELLILDADATWDIWLRGDSLRKIWQMCKLNVNTQPGVLDHNWILVNECVYKFYDSRVIEDQFDVVTSHFLVWWRF